MAINTPSVDNIENFTAAGKASKADKAKSALGTNFNDFLKLLTTQLQNQDPTDPMKAENFTQQIASLSQVEQQVNTNKNLESLISMISNTQLNNSVNYIGKVVEAEGDDGILTENGGAFGYNLATVPESVTVTISDSTGKVVYTGEGSKEAGRNVVSWDGTNSYTGAKMPPGTYSISVKAIDGAGKDVTATPFTIGVVQSVEMKDGVATLNMGDISVTMDKITAIRNS